MPKVENKFAETYRDSRAHAAGLIVSFAMLVGLVVGVGLVTPDAEESELENRRLQALPAFPEELLGIPAFVTKLERYAVDQAGFRDECIRWQRLLRFRLFGILRSDDFIMGKDNWLFVEMRRLDSFTYKDVISGRAELDVEQASRWIPFLREQADWLDARGIRFAVTFIPNKYAVYPEKLPDWLDPDLDRIPYLPILRGLQDNPKMRVTDLRPALIDAKDWSLLYSKADFHWNGRGAYIGYRELLRLLNPWFPELAVVPLDQFNLKSETLLHSQFGKPVAGLARLTGMPEEFSHQWLSVEHKDARAIEVDVADLGILESRITVQAPAAFERDGATGPRTMYIGDSFRWPLTHLLAEHTERILFVDARTTLFDRALIESENLDLVVFSVHSYFYAGHQNPYEMVEQQTRARESRESDEKESNSIPD